MKYVALLVLLLSAVGFVIWYKTVPLSIEEITPLVEILKKQRIELRNKQLAEMSTGKDIAKQIQELEKQKAIILEKCNNLELKVKRMKNAMPKLQNEKKSLEIKAKINELERITESLEYKQSALQDEITDLDSKYNKKVVIRSYDPDRGNTYKRQQRSFSWMDYKTAVSKTKSEMRKINSKLKEVKGKINIATKELKQQIKIEEAKEQKHKNIAKSKIDQIQKISEQLQVLRKQYKKLHTTVKSKEEELCVITAENNEVKEKIKEELQPENIEKIAFVEAHIILTVLEGQKDYDKDAFFDSLNDTEITTTDNLLTQIKFKKSGLGQFISSGQFLSAQKHQIKKNGLSFEEINGNIIIDCNNMKKLTRFYNVVRKKYAQNKSFVHKLFNK